MQTEKTSPHPVHVVLVDDSETDLEILRRSLSRAPFDHLGTPAIETYTDAADALAHLPATGITVVVCDYSMPGSTGLDWLPDFVRAGVGPVIILTGQGDEQVATEAFRNGAADYLIKSTVLENPELLPRAVREAVRRYRLEQRNTDLSRQLKIANAELQRKNARLSELTATAHRFVDDVAHEFRTPLTAVREFASIISDGIGGPVTDKQHEFLGYILDATRDLAQLVDDFLDSSKLKAGSLRVERRPECLDAIVDRVRPLLACRAGARDIRIVEEITPGLPPVFVDAEKAARIVVNLVVNAIKFSPHGGEVRIRAGLDTEGDVEVAVIDSGRGMGPEEVNDMFDRFRQASDGGDVKGFGLGLSIVRELVWLNLGDVRVSSRPGEGSTFAFTMPVWRQDAVVRRYLECMADRAPNSTVTILAARPEEPVNDGEALRAFLASTCFPMDLVTRADTDDAPVLLFGVTGEPERWTSRLRAAAGAPSRFLLEQLGCFPIDQSGPAIERALSTDRREVRRCA